MHINSQPALHVQTVVPRVSLVILDQREHWLAQLDSLRGVPISNITLLVDNNANSSKFACMCSQTGAPGILAALPRAATQVLELELSDSDLDYGIWRGSQWIDRIHTLRNLINPYTREATALLRLFSDCEKYCVIMHDDVYPFTRPEYSWTRNAIDIMEADPGVVSISPWWLPGIKPESDLCWQRFGDKCIEKNQWTTSQLPPSLSSVQWIFSDRWFVYHGPRMRQHLLQLPLLHQRLPSLEQLMQWAARTANRSSWQHLVMTGNYQDAWAVRAPFQDRWCTALQGENCTGQRSVLTALALGRHPASQDFINSTYIMNVSFSGGYTESTPNELWPATVVSSPLLPPSTIATHRLLQHDVQIVIFVWTPPTAVRWRQMVRNTTSAWSLIDRARCEQLFAMYSDSEREADTRAEQAVHGDLAILDAPSFKPSGRKLWLMLVWGVQHRSEADLIFKQDADAIVDWTRALPRMLPIHSSPPRGLLLGRWCKPTYCAQYRRLGRCPAGMAAGLSMDVARWIVVNVEIEGCVASLPCNQGKRWRIRANLTTGAQPGRWETLGVEDIDNCKWSKAYDTEQRRLHLPPLDRSGVVEVSINETESFWVHRLKLMSSFERCVSDASKPAGCTIKDGAGFCKECQHMRLRLPMRRTAPRG